MDKVDQLMRQFDETIKRFEIRANVVCRQFVPKILDACVKDRDYSPYDAVKFLKSMYEGAWIWQHMLRAIPIKYKDKARILVGVERNMQRWGKGQALETITEGEPDRESKYATEYTGFSKRSPDPDTELAKIDTTLDTFRWSVFKLVGVLEPDVEKPMISKELASLIRTSRGEQQDRLIEAMEQIVLGLKDILERVKK